MKKLIITLAVALTAAFTGLRAQTDTSYLLIQGPFGTDGAVETFTWAANYSAAQLANGLSGFDLLTAALTSNGITALNYGTADSPFEFVTGLTVTGSNVVNSAPVYDDPDYFNDGNYAGHGNSWTYYTAGASDSSWSFNTSGVSDSPLSNGSFDAWVYGYNSWDSDGNPVDYPAVAAGDPGDVNAPGGSSFADATQTTVVPEPASISLLAIAAGGALLMIKRRRA